jgi:high-affinity K+ transport system ATPase subunit B
MNAQIKKQPTYRRQLYQRAVLDSFLKLDPRKMVRNPVMFVVEVGSVLTTALWIQALLGKGEAPAGFIGAVALWLWFTVVFANFAEAMAEGRGKAQAEALRRTRQTMQAKKLRAAKHEAGSRSFRHPPCAEVICSWWKPMTSSRRMVRFSKGLPQWTRAPSPAKAPR